MSELNVNFNYTISTDIKRISINHESMTLTNNGPSSIVYKVDGDLTGFSDVTGTTVASGASSKVTTYIEFISIVSDGSASVNIDKSEVAESSGDYEELSSQLDNVAQSIQDLTYEVNGNLNSSNFETDFINDLNGGTVPPNGTVTEEKTTFMTSVLPDNKFDISNVVTGRILNDMTNDGNVDWQSSNHIEVLEGEQYSWGTSYGLRDIQAYRIWDSDNAIVEEYIGVAKNSATIPSGGVKMVLVTYGTFAQDFMVIQSTEAEYSERFPTEGGDFVPYVAKYYELDVYVKSEKSPITMKSKWAGKTLIAIGDSLTEYKPGYIEENLLKSFPYLIRDRLGFDTLYRCCYWGQGMEDYQNIVDHSANGYLIEGGTQEVANGLPYKDGTTDGDFLLGDACILFLGMNNNTITNFGDITDTPQTGEGVSFISATKFWIEKILSINPAIQIFIASTSIVTSSESSYETLNENLSAMSDVLKSVAKLYRIKFIDVFNECEFNSLNEEYFYYDGTSVNTVHPNEDGHERLYKLFRDGIGY